VAGFDRNGWPTSIGIGGRIASESVAGFDRNPQSLRRLKQSSCIPLDNFDYSHGRAGSQIISQRQSIQGFTSNDITKPSYVCRCLIAFCHNDAPATPGKQRLGRCGVILGGPGGGQPDPDRKKPRRAKTPTGEERIIISIGPGRPRPSEGRSGDASLSQPAAGALTHVAIHRVAQGRSMPRSAQPFNELQ
jgi:hypothetical protein